MTKMIFNALLGASTKAHAFALLKNSRRSFSFKAFFDNVYDYFHYGSGNPPYRHVCQIGDPVLRTQTQMVDEGAIRSPEFKEIVQHLAKVMRHYGAFGLAAPQIGLPWQVFAIEVTEKGLKDSGSALGKILEMEPVPLTYFINPTLRITDHTLVEHTEMCASFRGYSAVVPRPTEVEITATDLSGERFTWRAKGWSARIVQHEYDHLQGKLITDRMHRSTLSCECWEAINAYGGKVILPYRPRRFLRS